MDKKQLIKAIAYLLGAIATALLMVFGLSGCSASRVITTRAESVQRGDTLSIIQTKTIETYTGEKK